MARTQKNKATNYHLGTLKAKLAKLNSELVNGPGGKSSGTKNSERGFDVSKSGDTRVGLVGFPSVGKSTLLTALTGTRSEAAAYEVRALCVVVCVVVSYIGSRLYFAIFTISSSLAVSTSFLVHLLLPVHHTHVYSGNDEIQGREDSGSRSPRYYRGSRRRQGTWPAGHFHRSDVQSHSRRFGCRQAANA